MPGGQGRTSFESFIIDTYLGFAFPQQLGEESSSARVIPPPCQSRWPSNFHMSMVDRRRTAAAPSARRAPTTAHPDRIQETGTIELPNGLAAIACLYQAPQSTFGVGGTHLTTLV